MLIVTSDRVLEAMYPFSVITLGLNVTCLGYGDKLDFGLTPDPDNSSDP